MANTTHVNEERDAGEALFMDQLIYLLQLEGHTITPEMLDQVMYGQVEQ
ncbi:MAG: hypothetical protein H6908_03055 [Hyphomicrobiales bacterium]|nr:hypothetical protein [Hyphomicrobiales bacterium]